MNRQQTLANAILWAAAILAAAIVGAPAVLTLVLLPALYTASMVLTRRGT